MPSTEHQHRSGALVVDERHARPWMLASPLDGGRAWRLGWTDRDGAHETLTATVAELREHFTVVTPPPGPVPDAPPDWLGAADPHPA